MSTATAYRDVENPHYCASNFLFAATLTDEEKQLLLPVMGTTQPCHLDAQSTEGCTSVGVGNRGEDKGDLELEATYHNDQTWAQPRIDTHQTHSELQIDHDAVTLPLIMDDTEWLADIVGTGTRSRRASEEPSADSRLEKVENEGGIYSSWEITGDLERDLDIGGLTPGKL